MYSDAWSGNPLPDSLGAGPSSGHDSRSALPPMPGAYEDFHYSFPPLIAGLDSSPAIAAHADSQTSPSSMNWMRSPQLPIGQMSLPQSPRNPAFNVARAPPLDRSIDPSVLFAAPPLPPFHQQPSARTPPPLFDTSEQALFSSWLDGLNNGGNEDGHGGATGFEWDFDPRGMPSGMPALGELKQRLEMEEEVAKAWERQWSGEAQEGNDVGRQVGERLRISDDTEGGRKKVKTEVDGSYSDDHEMTERDQSVVVASARRPRRPSGKVAKRPSPPSPPESSPVKSRTQSQSGSRIVPPPPSRSPISTTPATATATGNSSVALSSTGVTASNLVPRPSHILSEQKRRSAIQGGFGALVAILHAGESQSGISIGTATTPALPLPGSNHVDLNQPTTTAPDEVTKKSKHAKGTGRGRGRRGEVETGASKSVVLERAVEYVRWMRKGNDAIKGEVARLEAILEARGLHPRG